MGPLSLIQWSLSTKETGPLSLIQWSLSTKEIPYTVEPLYKGDPLYSGASLQRSWGWSFVPYTVETLYKGQVWGWSPYIVEPLYKGQVRGGSLSLKQWSLSTMDKLGCPLYSGASLQRTSWGQAIGAWGQFLPLYNKTEVVDLLHSHEHASCDHL